MVSKVVVFTTPFVMSWDLITHNAYWLPFPICAFIVGLLGIFGDD